MHVGMTRFCRQWFSSPDKLAGGLSKIVMAESAPRFDSVFPETFSDVLSLNPFCKPFEFRFTRYSRLSLIKMFTLKRVIAWLTLLLFCEMSQRLYIYNCIIKQLLDSVFA